MTERHWFNHAINIGWFEFRRSVYAIRQDGRLILIGIGVAIPSIIIAGIGLLFVDAISSVHGAEISDHVRGTVAYIWLFSVFLITQRVSSTKHRVEAEPIMLTTVPTRTLVAGLIIAELLRFLAYVSLPLVVVGGLLAYGLTAPVLFLSLLLSLVLFGITAVTTGSMVGYGIGLLLETSPFVAKNKTALAVPTALIGIVGFSFFYYPQVTGISQSALAWLPIAWFTDLAVLGGPLNGSSLQAIGALVVTIIVVIVGGRVAEWETTSYWYSNEPTLPNDSDESDASTTENKSQSLASESLLNKTVSPFRFGLLPLPTRRVAQMTMLQAWRDPQRLIYVLLPVVLFLSSFLGTGGIADMVSVLPVVCAIMVPWIAGAAFPLNPFGDEGPVLPVTLTAATGSKYVQGLIAPGLILGLPTVVVITGIAAIVSPYTVGIGVSLIGLGIYLTIVSVALGPSIGMRLPQFHAINVGQADEVVPPRILAVTLHGVTIVLPGGLLALLIVQPDLAQTVVAVVFGVLPGFVFDFLVNSGLEPLAGASEWFRTVGETLLAISPTTFQYTASIILLIGGATASMAAYRDAIHYFNEYSPP